MHLWNKIALFPYEVHIFMWSTVWILHLLRTYGRLELHLKTGDTLDIYSWRGFEHAQVKANNLVKELSAVIQILARQIFVKLLW